MLTIDICKKSMVAVLHKRALNHFCAECMKIIAEQQRNLIDQNSHKMLYKHDAAYIKNSLLNICLLSAAYDRVLRGRST